MSDEQAKVSQPASSGPGLPQLFDQFTDSITKLHALGGYGYGLIAAGVATAAGTVLALNQIAQHAFGVLEKIAPWLVALALLAAAGGILVVLFERFMTYRMAEIKLTMIVDITQKMLAASLPKQEKLDTSQFPSIMKAVNEIWAMNVPKGPHS